MLPQEIQTRLTQLKGKQFKYDGQVYYVKGVNVDKDSGKFTITTDRNTFTRKLSVAPVFFESIKMMNGSIPKAEKTNGVKTPEPATSSSFDHQQSSVIVYATSDYSMFKMINGNRAINQHKVKRIIKEIENDNDMLRYYPIQVKESGDRLDILDGQHRFYIDQKLKRPVYYILVEEEKTMPDIAKVNSNVEKWTSSDYINCYIQQDNEHYKELKSFMDAYGFPATTALGLLSTGSPTTDGTKANLLELFRHGKFEAHHRDAAYEIADMAKSFSDYKYWDDRNFIVALYRIKKAELISIGDLLAAFKKRPEMLTPQKSFKEYIWNLEQIVNVNKQKRIVIV